MLQNEQRYNVLRNAFVPKQEIMPI